MYSYSRAKAAFGQYVGSLVEYRKHYLPMLVPEPCGSHMCVANEPLLHQFGASMFVQDGVNQVATIC